MTTVLVVGATGELGQRICRLLRRWTPSVRVVGANRSGRGHPDFPVHQSKCATSVARDGAADVRRGNEGVLP